MVKKILNIVLTLTLALQLFPATSTGRLFLFDTPEEECRDISESSKNQLRQFDEEQHKELPLGKPAIETPLFNLTILAIQLTERIPLYHYGSIHTPPPNIFA